MNDTQFSDYLKRAEGSKPKLLFLARPFPPAHAIGAVRTWNIAKHLSRLGWQVTVVTPHPSLRRHIDDAESAELNLKREGIRIVFTGHSWRCLSPNALSGWDRGLGWVVGGIARRVARRLAIEPACGWIKPAERACNHLTPADVDVILASGRPFVTFDIAKRLSDRLGRPYVLDYRDPWTSSRTYRAPRSVSAREKYFLDGAAAVTVASPAWAEALRDRFKLSQPVHAITNGYDPEDTADIAPYRFDHFALVYAGTFYPPRRVVTPLMLALQKLKEHPTPWYFHYYGRYQDYVAEEADKHGLMNRVVLHGYVPRRESLSAMRGAAVNVVIADEANTGSIPAKLFELIALGAPILFIGSPQGDAAAICRESGRAEGFGGGDTDGIAAFLAGLMEGRELDFRSGENYSWPVLARKFEHVLLRAAGLDSPVAELSPADNRTAASVV